MLYFGYMNNNIPFDPVYLYDLSLLPKTNPIDNTRMYMVI